MQHVQNILIGASLGLGLASLVIASRALLVASRAWNRWQNRLGPSSLWDLGRQEMDHLRKEARKEASGQPGWGPCVVCGKDPIWLAGGLDRCNECLQREGRDEHGESEHRKGM